MRGYFLDLMMEKLVFGLTQIYGMKVYGEVTEILKIKKKLIFGSKATENKFHA